ncbi:MAG: DsbA family protein [Solirubrobacteraceae bacterium]
MPGPQVDVWIDPICPFCYVAVERAAWLRERFGAEIRWHPFDLHPEYPAEGIPREELTRRMPGADEFTRTLIGDTGLPFAGLPERIPNSRNAQRVALAAGERRGEMLQRLADAYWGRGRDIGDDEVLVEEAAAVGLDEEQVRHVIGSDAHLDDLLTATRVVTEHGATGVPAWVIDDRALVPGAQPHEVFEQVLGRLGHS